LTSLSGTGRGAEPDVPESTSLSLLERIRAQDPEAWCRLVDLCAPLLYEWCRKHGLKAEDASDVAQEVFAAVAMNIRGFRRDRPGDSFHGWLWTITENKIRDRLRDRKGQPEAKGGTEAQIRLSQVPEPLSDTSTLGMPRSYGSPLERRAIELVRASVEERTWQAFWRVVVEGQEAATVAQELGISVPAVYKAKYRIRRKVRHELAGLPE
jgi:RNA polymerase sigma-70 factor, ECF subfamily